MASIRSKNYKKSNLVIELLLNKNLSKNCEHSKVRLKFIRNDDSSIIIKTYLFQLIILLIKKERKYMTIILKLINFELKFSTHYKCHGTISRFTSTYIR